MLRTLALAAILAVPAALPSHAFELAGDTGTVSLDAPPESVAALSWGLAEMAADLGLPLAGVADVEGYRTWVGTPALPQEVRDVGLRTEPNLEALGALEPGLILGSDQQIDMASRLDDIAPVWIRDHFSAAHDNAETARRTYRDLAAAFGKLELAERRLIKIDAAMQAAGDRVRTAWQGEVPPILPVRLLTPTTVRIHGPNSMAAAAIGGMGLTAAASGAPTDWGFVTAPIEALADYPDAAIVHIDPFAEKDALFASPLWSAIPAVAAGRFAVADLAWTFGGVVSLEILAERIADALVATTK
ncbi:Iron(III)-hydroxamate-binding protein FhuD [Jannaschia seosinensis]|uniref:Iron(III)-hydroxamate-binding protein FhuD n=1 Tax=Jannaschia seosinensis TaxID=313367 RepID=A0A0M7B914_9RHOB|nr:iron-siderophore ABC transporter substrate-binding protein [Jannaschia seosinensis]CUH39277.1 Iron(III)-hydroxamate-binding protein FhuD [Jannaschia seosinensis]